jgi:Ca2+-binding RTX toxin-like protein
MTLTSFYNGNSVADLTTAAQWLGRNPDLIDLHGGSNGWSDWLSSVGWEAGLFKGQNVNIAWSIPLIPYGANLATAAAGGYNANYLAMAKQLVANAGNNGQILVRLGWEFNGAGWNSSSAVGQAQNYVKAFQDFVTVARTVSDKFVFEWCPNVGTTDMNPELAYPGDKYVDIIGTDFYYNTAWDSTNAQSAFNWFVNEPYGLQWQQDFAAAHGKQTAIGEWGLNSNSPQFVKLVSDWATSHNMVYQNYWNSNAAFAGELDDGQYANAAAEFKALWGAVTAVAKPTTLTGTAAADTLNAVSGINAMTGGAGNDTFVIAATSTATTISDFGANGDADMIDISAALTAGLKPTLTQSSANTVISFTNGSTITLANVTVAELKATATGYVHVDKAQTFAGTSGNDSYKGGSGDDTISGGNGNDTLWGGDGNDVIDGGAGNDWLSGQGGNNMLTGGAGIDTFKFAINIGNDTVTDFGANGDADMLDFSEQIAAGLTPTLTQQGNDTLISFANGSSVLLQNVTTAELNPTATGFVHIDKPMVFRGGSSDDIITGGSGSDTLWGGDGNDVINGGAGNDWLSGQGGNNTLTGGAGIDTFKFAINIGNDTVTDFGANGDADTLNFAEQLAAGLTPTLTQQGADTLISFTNGSSVLLQNVTVAELKATDTGFVHIDKPVTYVGTSGNDSFKGGSGNDTISGGAGSDTLWGGGGNDVIDGGAGNDWLSGQGGNNVLTGGAGIDTFKFAINIGNDTVTDFGANGDADTLNFAEQLAAGLTPMVTQQGADTSIAFTNGSSVLLKGVTTAELKATTTGFVHIDKPITYTGTSGADSFKGGSGNDTLSGGGGSDTLWGGDGDDTISGGDGNDWLSGQGGNNTLTGGAGADTFKFAINMGHDTITDFGFGGADRIDISEQLAAGFKGTLSQQGTDTLISFANGSDIRLSGVTMNALTQTTSGYVFGH